jgi:hypothetical protein
MKASSLLKAYCWAELGFVAYLLLRKDPEGSAPAEGGALEQLTKTVEEKINAHRQAQEP